MFGSQSLYFFYRVHPPTLVFTNGSPSKTAEAKNAWSYSSIPYVMNFCLMKYR